VLEASQVPKFQAIIVEDHAFQRRIVAQVLTRCGADVVCEAASGSEALLAIEQRAGPFDLLLCDLKMPGMDGLEFLRHIAERKSASGVILVSGLDHTIIRAAELMAQNYGVRLIGAIEKPITQEKLLPLILRHFGQSFAPPKPEHAPIPLEAIRAGLAAQQFEPFFQPKVDMRTFALAGAEALMRWRHPELGLVSPAAFIPAMEAHDLISGATLTLAASALSHCRRWRDNGLNVAVSINVSAKLLTDTELPDRLTRLVEAAQLEPSFLTIEVTETTAMTDFGHSLETLARIRMRGFGLSIDDYGTGFSSMQQLARIPFSEIKIDQVFVTGAGKDEIRKALLETSLRMARQLGLTSVAEGIESSGDWDIAAELGCNIAQGYYIAKPMPAEELLDWYATWLETHASADAACCAVH